jgi:DNA-binding SARP family transcriptional activator
MASALCFQKAATCATISGMANVSDAPISLFLLGSFDARVSDRNSNPVLDRKTRAILAYLAATGQPHSRQRLYSLFCQEALDPAGTLRWHLSRIRRHLSPEIIVVAKETVKFNRQVAWVDCALFQTTLDPRPVSLDLEVLASVLDLYRGEFLAGMALADSPEFELWLLGERSRLRQLYEWGLAELIERLIACGRHASAIQRAQQLLQSNPLLEEAHARLAWLYARTGQRAAALQQFERCRDLLRHELDVEPAQEFVHLRDQILHHELGVDHVELGKEDAYSSQSQFSNAQSAPDLQFSILAESFVGRDVELAQLHQAWHMAQRQGGAIVLIEAEAGGGKTRLAQVFGRDLPGALFLTGQCYESTRTVPYRPWVDILQARLALVDDRALAELSPYWLEQLKRLLPELAARHGAQQFAAVPPTLGEQEHLWTAVAEVLLRLPAPDGKAVRGQAPGSGTPPLLLFIDDLQWADEASLGLFHFVAQRLRRHVGAPALLLGAFRSEEADDNPALLTLIRDLRRFGPLISLALPPLGALAIDTLIEQLWPDLPPGYRLPHIRDTFIEGTGGNPLFVTELLRELAQAPVLPAPLPIPPSLRDLIQRRLSQLSASGRQVVEALAVLDAPATLALTQHTSGRSEDETANAIDVGLRWRLLQPVGRGSVPRFDFSHALMREAVAIHLSDVRRQRLHQRAAVALEQSGAPPATLAHHWGMAGDVAKEGLYTALAGESAADVYANDEAIHYLQRALELVAEPERRPMLMIRLGNVKSLMGKWSEAEAIYQDALALTKRIGDVRSQAQATIQLGQLKFNQGDHSAALAFFEQAKLQCEATSDQAGLCEALGGMGTVLLQHGQLTQALACFEHWLQVATTLGDRRAVSRAMGRLGLAYVHLADDPRALDCFEQQLQLAIELGDRLGIGDALGNLANIYQIKLFDYSRAWDYRQQEIQLWSEIGNARGLAWAVGNLTELYLDRGQYEHVLVCGQRHLQLCVDSGERLGITLALGRLARALAQQGQAQEAERLLRRELALGRILSIPFYLCYALGRGAELYFQQQRYAQAQQLNDEALVLARAARRTEVEFSALVLSIRLRLALREIDVPTTIRELEALGAEWPDEREQASLHYELWQLQPDPARSRYYAAAAVERYHTLYRRTCWADDRQRYEELGGEALPNLPPLPAPPPIVTAHPVDFEALLAQVDKITDELKA